MNLQRTMNDRVIAGICGGIAKLLGIKPTLVRWGFVLLVFFFGLSIITYFIAWFLIPRDSL